MNLLRIAYNLERGAAYKAGGGRASPAPDEAIGTKSARRLSVVNADPKQLKAVYVAEAAVYCKES